MAFFRIILLAGLAALAGCTDLRSTYQSTAACVHDQFFDRIQGARPVGGRAVFMAVINQCGDPVPDLTGDTMDQAVAITYNVPFRINLARDTEIKQRPGEQIITTGSRIPLPPLIYPKS